jgi:hypothetical protein
MAGEHYLHFNIYSIINAICNYTFFPPQKVYFNIEREDAIKYRDFVLRSALTNQLSLK